MIKEALEYIVGLGEAKIHTVMLDDGTCGKFSDKQLHRIMPEVYYAKGIEMTTLSSLVEYIKSGVDEMSDRMIIHVASPTSVSLYSCLDEYRKREKLVDVVAEIPSFPFGKFIGHEDFTINVQSKFIDDPATDRALILKFAGTVESGTVAQYSDDGISQKATVKTGIASKGDAVVPSPVRLMPFRTFVDVKQPASDFVFRMKEVGDSIHCALFEADGGAWKSFAKENIKEYLLRELEDRMDRFTVIS